MTMLEFWEDWKWDAALNPFEHAMTFLVGLAIGLFSGFTIGWLLT